MCVWRALDATLMGSNIHSVYASGTLHDGSQFDSSRERGFPFTFNIGFRQVIRGEAIAHQQVPSNARAALPAPPRRHIYQRGMSGLFSGDSHVS